MNLYWKERSATNALPRRIHDEGNGPDSSPLGDCAPPDPEPPKAHRPELQYPFSYTRRTPTNEPEVNTMPKSKWNLNTVYISERLQESLRPISRCALTAMVAPMGYGKTTAVNWYLAERARVEATHIIRISIYSNNLAILWKSVQDAFDRAGFDFLRDYSCPTDAAGGGLLADDLCHELAGETPCYLFIDDFHLLTDDRVSDFLCTLAHRLPETCT